MRSVNPLVIPRNHKIEEALEMANNNNLEIFHKLLKILEKPYIQQENILDYLKMGDTTKGYITFCGT